MSTHREVGKYRSTVVGGAAKKEALHPLHSPGAASLGGLSNWRMEAPQRKMKPTEYPEAVADLMARITAERTIYADLLGLLTRTASELEEVTRNMAQAAREVKDRDIEIAKGKGPLPESPYGGGSTESLRRQNHRILTARKDLIRPEVEASRAKIADLSAKLRAEWLAHADKRADEALARYAAAVAQAMDALIDIVAWSRNIDGRSVRRRRRVPVLVASETNSPSWRANATDPLWMQRCVLPSDSYRAIRSQHESVLAFLSNYEGTEA